MNKLIRIFVLYLLFLLAVFLTPLIVFVLYYLGVL